MGGRSFEDVRDELNRLVTEQVESLKKQTFSWLNQEELRQQDVRLDRIRDVSADYLAGLRNYSS